MKKIKIVKISQLRNESFKNIGEKIGDSLKKIITFEDNRIGKLEKRIFSLEKELEILRRK